MEALFQTIQAYQLKKTPSITVIGIDGPTASGKTTLADTAATWLQAQGIETWVYRVDWTLASRADRLKDLAQLRAHQSGFPYEAELHMRMEQLHYFLLQIKKFNEEKLSSYSITLDQLYSRETGGTLDGTQTLVLKPGMVILVEGHYTLRTEIDKLLDYNVVLLAEFASLLQRKKNRVKDYRSFAETEDYFYRIDLPSFQHHLKRYGNHADLVLDNTSFDNIKVLQPAQVKQWAHYQEGQLPIPALDPQHLAHSFFAYSLFGNHIICEAFEAGIALIKAWDEKVGHSLRCSFQELEQDFQAWFSEQEQALQSRLQAQQLRIEVSYSDALYNVYYRKQPLSMGVSVWQGDAIKVAFTADVFQESLHIYAVWAGGYKRLSYQRMLGDISKSSPVFSEKHFLQDTAVPFTLFTPTDFTIPEFLICPHNRVLIGKEGENMTSSQIMDHLLTHGGVWIHRFALFSEMRFFDFALTQSGCLTVQIGNYLIAVRSFDAELVRRFKDFAKAYTPGLASQAILASSQDALDKLVRQERVAMANYVNTHSRYFVLKDGVLFSQFMYESEDKVKEALEELRGFLLSPLRLLRKRATQFIFRYFPDLVLSSQDIWYDLPSDAKSNILLEDWIRLGPSIFAELYLWLGLRHQPSAILATNVYDIGANSLDARAFLQTAAHRQSPIVLQNSLNASGQKELSDKGEVWGYLQPRQGPEDFLEAAARAARDLFLTQGTYPPLYSLGLDHVNVENDRPQGRAKRFFDRALKTGLLTHVVLDGSALFKAESREDMALAYEKVAEFEADLIDDPEATCLLDREICAGELSFVGDTPVIPTPDELKGFLRCYQRHLIKKGHEALLARPMLYVANLGTTHHGADTVSPQTGLADIWNQALKADNLVSAVLHGTTHTQRRVLAEASSGCHKINVAGDLLHRYVKALPEAVKQRLLNAGRDPKLSLAAFRSEIEALPDSEKAQVVTAMQAICQELLDTIQSPQLTEHDQNYFRYMSYRYSDSVAALVMKAVADRIKPQEPKKMVKPTSGFFSASMIEVPLEEMKPIIDRLWHQGLTHFHIDEGDGRFITRQFSGVEKAKMLREKFPNAILHAHIMAQNPHLALSGESLLDQYIASGCTGIAVHPRSLSDVNDLSGIVAKLRGCGVRPGIVIETHDPIHRVFNMALELGLDWVVIMGVPIGYGGQIFQFSTLYRIAQFKALCEQASASILIEVDGGLTFENLSLCCQAGGDLFAGWSIIKPDTKYSLEEKIEKVKSLLNS